MNDNNVKQLYFQFIFDMSTEIKIRSLKNVLERIHTIILKLISTEYIPKLMNRNHPD